MRFAAALAAALLFTSCGSTANPTQGESSPASTPTEDTAPSTPNEDAALAGSLPFNASGLLGGTAQPTFPDGEQGEVSVVQVGPLAKPGLGATLLFAFRNNTSEGISHVDWSATVRSDGAIVSTGSSQGTVPDQVQSGEVGLAYIYFSNGEIIPGGAEYEFTVNTSPVNTQSYNTAPFKVTEANISGDAIVGSALNETGAESAAPYSVSVYCFDGDNLLSQFRTYTEQDGPIKDGGSVTFTADLYGQECPSFVVGVGGYFS
ncbi:hypothetical protein [Homoserinimonas sp. OAct 916]|uniref:hypothetical protein n=1 Tax=Homoserinimonas sp. OAct 916 TaxID=2211450 RepID=UPI000DBE2B60|nr:hypothetical protein [Homoserinimonas sp. OAct 916]